MIILKILGVLFLIWIVVAGIAYAFSKEKDGWAQIACLLWPLLLLGKIGAWFSERFGE